LKVTPEIEQAVGVLAKKLAKAIFYMETGQIFPAAGSLILFWFTNIELHREGRYAAFELLRDVTGKAPTLERGKQPLNDQFEYKISFTEDKGAFALQVNFGSAFGFVVFGSAHANLIDSAVRRLRESGRPGSIVVLQSQSHAAGRISVQEQHAEALHATGTT